MTARNSILEKIFANHFFVHSIYAIRFMVLFVSLFTDSKSNGSVGCLLAQVHRF